MITGRSQGVVGEIIYDLTTQGYTDEQLDDPTFQKEINVKAQELRRKYGVENNPLFTNFDVFYPLFEAISYFNCDLKTTDLGVNTNIRVSFLAVVGTISELKRNLYTLELVTQRAEGINVLLSGHRKLIADSEKAIKFILDQEGVLKQLRIFKNLDTLDIHLSKPKDINFENVLRNLSSVVELSDDDKKEAEKRVENHLKEHV